MRKALTLTLAVHTNLAILAGLQNSRGRSLGRGFMGEFESEMARELEGKHEMRQPLGATGGEGTGTCIATWSSCIL